jgi:imidazolonepropionase-like amidohydrolase
MTPIAFLAGVLLASTGQEQGTTAFVHVTVVPMAGTEEPLALPDHTVVVTGGRIAAVGPSAEVALPEGAVVIDGGGRWLMPGLVDMHVHTWGAGELLLFVANGVTTVRNMFGAPLHLMWRREIAAGERLGPTIVTAGPIVDGSPPIWPGSRVIQTPDDARAAVREQAEAGYDFIKVYARVPLEAYLALMAAAAEAGLPVDGHVPSAVGLPRALEAGQRTLEHLIGYESWLEPGDSPLAGMSGTLARLGAWEHIDRGRMAEVAEETAASGAWNCATLVVMQKWLAPDEVERELERPELRYVAPFLIGVWKGMHKDLTAEALAAGRGGDDERRELVGALHRGGARILLGTDCGNPWVPAGFSAHEELANLVAAGLSPHAALYAATRAPAECLGQEDEFGAVLPGLRADLLLLAADPLADVRAAAQRVGVMLRGQWLPEEDLRERLEELAAANGAPAPAPAAARPALELEVTAEAPSHEAAAVEYREIWDSQGPRIVEAMERATGLRFEAGPIPVVVYEGPSSSGFGAEPMRMRASYSRATKQATLVHELAHRLISELVPQSFEDHPVIFLFVYDVWVELWGQPFADEQVAVESARRGSYDYESAWKEALALTPEERAARFRQFLTEHPPK